MTSVDPNRRVTNRLHTATVLHIEDNTYFANTVAQLLRKWPEVSYIGVASGANDGLAMCREKAPSIVLLDLWLPDGDGLELIERIASLVRKPYVLLLTCRQDDLTLYNAWCKKDKISGLIWKTARSHEHLRAGIASVLNGERYFPEEVANAIDNYHAASEALHKVLTPRQQEFMNHVARGETNTKIATSLRLTLEGVRSQKKRIMAKLALHRLYDLWVWAIKKGFGGRPPPGWNQ